MPGVPEVAAGFLLLVKAQKLFQLMILLCTFKQIAHNIIVRNEEEKMMGIESKRAKSIFFIFFLSGMSALIYEVVWLRILIRVLGCTVYATSTILGSFMAGLALGSYTLGKCVDRSPRLLRLYAFLELGIALSAFAMPFVFELLVPVYRWVYDLTNESTLSSVRAGLVFLCLIVPTTLMGGTLPVLSGFLAREKSQFGNRMGTLYGINTLGAIVGVLGSGFFFIGHLGEFNTILIGIGGNLYAASVAFYLNRKQVSVQSISADVRQTVPHQMAREAAISPYSNRVRLVVMIAFAVSGFAALGYEVVWTRILPLFLETSIYAFSAMLSIYLIGIALGSLWGRKFVDRLEDPVYLFAILEIVIAFFAVLGLILLVPIDKKNLSGLLAASVLIFPVTICLGILFPTVARCFTKSEESIGKSIGQIYSVNTVGCILGSLTCGFIFIPVLGSARTILVLSGINLLIGITLLLAGARTYRQTRRLSFAIAGIICTLLAAQIVHDPFYQITKQRIKNMFGDNGIIYLHRESIAATVTAFGSLQYPLWKQLWINGYNTTILVTDTKLMAHLPILLTENPKDVLIVCFGMGTTLRSAVVHENLAVDVVDLVPDTYDAYEFFHRDGPEILKNPRVNHFVDDGRNYLLMRDKSYSVITIDPAPPIHSAGTVNLYSREFITLCKDHLDPNGTLCLWIPEAHYTEVRMIMQTFQSVFPHTSVWKGPVCDGLYLIGTQKPVQIPLDRFHQAFKNKKFLEDINELDKSVYSGDVLADLFILNETELAEYLQDVPIITDNYPYTEFPLWRSLLDPNRHKYCNPLNLLHWKEQRKVKEN
jgi:spermidine synthase